MFQMQSGASRKGRAKAFLLPLLMLSVSACTSLGASGPSSRALGAAAGRPVDTANIQLVDVDNVVAQRVAQATARESFSDVFGDVPPTPTIIGVGDSLAISIMEAPPAALFGGNASFGPTTTGAILASSAAPPQQNALPEMTVDSSGQIRVPFAGTIRAVGRTPQQIERDIMSRLAGMAHDPQVSVRVVANANDAVTVVGDVATNARVPLSARGERLLDAIALVGGTKQPVGKTVVQVSRDGRAVMLPLEAVISNPAQNIRLKTGDVVTALYQPFSFTGLGATGTSSEIPFEATGLTLAQALGRVGGLREDRANIRGVFIFRFEDPAVLDPARLAGTPRTREGKIPVIYKLNLGRPETMFIAQRFPIRDKDILYVSSAPLTDIQKFLGVVSGMAFTAIGLGQAVP